VKKTTHIFVLVKVEVLLYNGHPIEVASIKLYKNLCASPLPLAAKLLQQKIRKVFIQSAFWKSPHADGILLISH
jgi:hypothetical protein